MFNPKVRKPKGEEVDINFTSRNSRADSRVYESDLKKFKAPLNIENVSKTSKATKSKIDLNVTQKTRNEVPKKRYESVIENSLPALIDRSVSPTDRKIQKQAMLSTIAPFESLTKTYSRAVVEELFKGNNNYSTIANSKFPSIPFGKQTGRKSGKLDSLNIY